MDGIDRTSRITLCMLLLILLGSLSLPAQAQSQPKPVLEVVTQADGTHMRWQNTAATTRNAQPATDSWPQVEIGGYRVPAKLVAFRVDSSAPLDLQIEALASKRWQGQLQTVVPPIPQTLDGELRPDLAATQDPALPTSPVVVLRDGVINGTRIVVLAFSPLFADGATTRTTTNIDVMIPHAQLLTDDPQVLLDQVPATATRRATTTALTPHQSVRAPVAIRVATAGMQRVFGARLAAAGLDLGAIDPSNIHLYHKGVEVALQINGTADGRIDATDELRFYAAAPGDRWNAVDVYQLTVETTPGLRMPTRNASAGNASVRTTAVERGLWRDFVFYDSLMPGPAEDHWYATDLRTGPGSPAASVTVPLTPTLPLAGGAMELEIGGSTYTNGPHTLRATAGNITQQSTWEGTGSYTVVLTPTAAPSVQVVLAPSSAPSSFELMSVRWSRAAALDFAGNGALFEGVDGTWRYQLANTPVGRTLYDITDPIVPAVLTISGGTNPIFQDGPTARRYLLSGPGTTAEPDVRAHGYHDLLAPLNANAVYIAPAVLHDALAPLVTRRQVQGYAATIVDVQDIYDTWGYGSTSPDAIRDFLRYARATWTTPPAAVVLVGDGTSDPLNYTKRNNETLIPPYLAYVDPWLGESACDACYAQLDGDDPLADALPDLMFGRLPVKSAAELQALVTKIIGYETRPTEMSWQSRMVLIADNFREANNTPDQAGDFAAQSDLSAAYAPMGMDIRKVYYDPLANSGTEPWREANAGRARERTIAAIDQGAGLVVYDGHSNHWQWATTDFTADPPYLFGLYDVDGLTNGHQLPIVLSMTCLSSAFQQPAFSGTTIDERFMLKPDGGAIAVWGPTGLGVNYGHSALYRGFSRALWAAPPQQATLGSLTMAGYTELFTNGTCCQDTLRTFVLLGDPLTPARVLPATRSYLPIVR